MSLEAPTIGAGGAKAELFPKRIAADGDEEDVLDSQDVVTELWAF